MKTFKELVWPELESTWDHGRLHVKGYPRWNFESNVDYFRRIAFEYTKQHGLEVRDDWLAHRYKEGHKVDSLAVDFGLSVVSVKKILRQLGVMPPPVKHVPDPQRDKQIYALHVKGQKCSTIAKTYGLSTSRISQLIYQEHRRREKDEWRRLRYVDKKIKPPDPDLIDTWLVSEEWTPEMQMQEFNRHRDIDIA